MTSTYLARFKLPTCFDPVSDELIKHFRVRYDIISSVKAS